MIFRINAQNLKVRFKILKILRSQLPNAWGVGICAIRGEIKGGPTPALRGSPT